MLYFVNTVFTIKVPLCSFWPLVAPLSNVFKTGSLFCLNHMHAHKDAHAQQHNSSWWFQALPPIDSSQQNSADKAMRQEEEDRNLANAGLNDARFNMFEISALQMFYEKETGEKTLNVNITYFYYKCLFTR